MTHRRSSSRPGLTSKTMFDLSKKASGLVKQMFGGNETENMIAAGVMRTILADITRLYFENKKALGKGILVFNGEDPEKSKYLTLRDLDQDLALAEEMMHKQTCRMFKKIIEFIEDKHESDLALVAMIQSDGVALHVVDPKEANKRIDEFTRGLIF